MNHPALLFTQKDDHTVECHLCAHRCVIKDQNYGICGVRQNQNGQLITHAYGEVIAAHVDPIEKKPFYHVLPGSRSFSIATYGCNFRCDFCQNWQISQIRGEAMQQGHLRALSPDDIVQEALTHKCQSIAYTYTEPTIFFEYALETAKLAQQKNLLNLFVTNGYMTTEAIELLAPYLDAANIDLKSFSDTFYQQNCKAHLQPVLETIQTMHHQGIWIEITTLIIPGLNDSEQELHDIAAFIKSIDTDIPWHISRFHPDYQQTTLAPTPIETLQKAKEIGQSHDLSYVYLGNVANEPNMLCPHCDKILVQRTGFSLGKNNIREGKCKFCGHTIAGLFS